MASAKPSAATSNACDACVAPGSADTAAAYTAGVATGSTAATTAQTTQAMGAITATLPHGSMSIDKGGTTYYLNGNTWYKPAYGANGVYYRIVPAP